MTDALAEILSAPRYARESRKITSRAEWLAWRREHITASRVAALFDAHPFLSRDQLAASLRGSYDQGDNPAMRAGRILEPGVLVAIAEEQPEWRVEKADTYHWLPELRFGATPDAWLGDDGLIQIKTVSPEEWERWQGKPPLVYSLQTLAEMIVTDRAHGVLAVMVRSRSYPLYLFDVPRHEAAEARILAAVEAWWAAWDKGEIPRPHDPEGLAEALDDGTVIDLSADNMLRELLEEREGLKTAEGRIKEIDEIIREKVGAARQAFLPGWSIALPTIARKEYTVKAGSYRRLTVRRTKEDLE